MVKQDDACNQREVNVDVIIPVHNAASTIEQAVRSAMDQEIPENLLCCFESYDSINVFVCCYDDGSKDESWSILENLKKEYEAHPKQTTTQNPEISKKKIALILLMTSSKDGVARGAGYARNRAIEMHAIENNSSSKSHTLQFLCLLDSDDTMHRHRVAEQLSFMLELNAEERNRTLLGCKFDRDPPNSTWHYSRWANSLSDERLLLEQFREVTILQPTWFLTRKRWSQLGGYVEAPSPASQQSPAELLKTKEDEKNIYRLIHLQHDNLESLRLAEDLRFFHAHLHHSNNGILRLHRTKAPLVTYRHTGTSQSFRTSRKLLLHLRALAFEQSILGGDSRWQQDDGQFVVWGAGRDGKGFVKALSNDAKKRVYCFVDVDAKKLETGWYVNRDLGIRIPIIHYSFLCKDANARQRIQQDWIEGATNDEIKGRIDKTKSGGGPSLPEASDQQARKKQKIGKTPKLELSDLCPSMLERLPVVICVAMYRTNGVLERNVRSIGREEGLDLWHFS